MRFLLGLSLAAMSCASVVSAQPVEWVIVPASTADASAWTQPTSQIIANALSQQGARVWSVERATAVFEQRGSVEPPEVTDEQIARLDALTDEALQLIVIQEYARALRVLRVAQRMVEDKIVALNRTEGRARRALDVCLYMVRALYETGDRTGAIEQARQCVRLVPGGEANRLRHPPEVVELHDKVSQPGPDKTGSLRVDSTPQGCDVRVNGLRLGQTPFEITDLYPADYQFQVECDPAEPGRVHRADVGAFETARFVDVELDRAVQTKPVLRLEYPDEPGAAEQRSRDALAVANVLQVGVVVLASSPTPGVLELELLDTADPAAVRLVRLATTPTGPDGEDARAAAAALIDEACIDLTGKKPVTIRCPGEEAGPARPPRGQWVAGLTLLSTGGASLLMSYGLVLWRRDTGNVVIEQVLINPDATTNQNQWLNLRTGIVWTAATGGALTTAAMPLLLPYRSKTPWWAWLSGGLGVGLAVGSIVSGVTAEAAPAGNSSCTTELTSVEDAQTCVDRGRSVDRAIILGATAAPLLTIPLVYLLRRDAKKQGAAVMPHIALGPTGGTILLEGTF